MERRKMVEGGVAIAILAALVVLIWLFLRGKAQQQPVVQEEKNTSLPSTENVQSTIIKSDLANAPQVQEVSAGTVARTFVERIGSYSSESDYQNVEDVLGMVTKSLGNQLQKDAEKARVQAPDNGGYYGISTVYIGAKTVKETETSITLLVQTQREESFGSPGNAEVRYQEIEVTLEKEGDVWKVSAYTWKE